jgi:hypothetical protein
MQAALLITGGTGAEGVPANFVRPAYKRDLTLGADTHDCLFSLTEGTFSEIIL